MVWLNFLWPKKKLSDDEIMGLYSALLEQAEILNSVSDLPCPKDRLKKAVIAQIPKIKTEEELNAMHASYLSLASFQNIQNNSLSSDIQRASKLSGDRLVAGVLRMGPAFSSLGRMIEIMDQERRLLDGEWQVAMASLVESMTIATESPAPCPN